MIDFDSNALIEPLTERELEILRLIAEGLSNREIAQELILSPETVKWYNKQSFGKLGVSNRTQAVTAARERGLLDGDRTSPVVRLPLQATPFIGREYELAELGDLLNDPATRLVTILGPGGIGKTRLALQAASRQSKSFSDGIYFVSLADLEDPNLIATDIANAINFSFQAREQREYLEVGHPYEQLLDYLRDRQVLLVLDNLEQLVKDLSLITKILQVAAGVTMLTTSRERLGLHGETVYTPGGMHVPQQVGKETLKSAAAHDALQFFAGCARRANARFELTAVNLPDVIAICRLVDGSPLGIELAAAWVGILTPQEIAAEIKSNLDFLSSDLQDIPDRQQSMRSVFESSWSRLSETEQVVFRQLTAFRGGFTRQAASSVTGATLQNLMNLVNKSLTQPDYSGRYHIHELLRQYGREKLGEAGEMERTRDAHLQFFLKFVQDADPKLKSAEQVKWVNVLEIENDNLRAALEWGRTAKGRIESGLLLAGSLHAFWDMRGYFDEGREHLAAALSRPDAQKQTFARAMALHAEGHLSYIQSDYPATRAAIEECLSIYRELGPQYRRELADALITLGDMETELGDYATATSLMKEGLVIMRDLGDKRGIGRALWQLGACAVRPGELDQATQYFEEALPFLREIGDRSHTAIALSGLAEIAIRQGAYERATVLEKESLALRREIDEPWGIAVSLGNFAWIALRQDDLPQAATLLAESIDLRREIGDKGDIAWCLEKLAEIALIRGQRESAQEEFPWAVRFFGTADALRAPIGSTIDLVDQPEHAHQVELLRTQLDEATFTAVWAEGQQMALDRAVEYALALSSD